jgi:hypothetical protein
MPKKASSRTHTQITLVWTLPPGKRICRRQRAPLQSAVEDDEEHAAERGDDPTEPKLRGAAGEGSQGK